MAQRLTPNSKVAYLKGVGEQRASLLDRLQIRTVSDLLLHKPHRWEDFSRVTPIADLQIGPATVKARVLEAKGNYLGYRGLHITEALVKDESGLLRVAWFNQPYRAQSLQVDAWYYFSGLYDLKYKRLQLFNPRVQLADEDGKSVQLIRPVYPATAGLKSSQIHNALIQARPLLGQMPETLPGWMLKMGKLPSLARSLEILHFPESVDQAQQALKDLNLRELIAVSLGSQFLKQKLSEQKALSLPVHKRALEDVIGALDFNLTGQQSELIRSIVGEMEEARKPLNRLIQGDVGAGKTLIAALVAFNVVQSGYQVAVMAPTQILAWQHFKTFQQVLGKFLQPEQLGLLTANLKAEQRKQVIRRIEEGRTQLVIGTHALLSKTVKFKRLALVVIDDQHRFGVKQRLQLLEKTDRQLGNILSLSATPIPRSLALALYADLDISLLKEKPPGRRPVSTKVIALKDRATDLQRILKTRSADNQIYVICPTIEDSQNIDSLNVIKEYLLKLDEDLKLGVLHGRLKSAEQERVMTAFQKGECEVLCSTSIVEAGLDIPNANTVVIMSPERFGLAQLHQIRGRVGRGQKQGQCYLCPYSDQDLSERLQAVLDYDDGFKLSEIDLRLRGPGTFYGWQQSGSFVVLQISLSDVETINLAVKLAGTFIEKGESLDKYGALKRSVTSYQQITHLN